MKRPSYKGANLLTSTAVTVHHLDMALDRVDFLTPDP